MPKHHTPQEHREITQHTPRPHILDVVKIDGRWAQVTLGGDSVRYLDEDTVSSVFIHWDDYTLMYNWHGLAVGDVHERSPFTDEEIERIVWGPEQKENPNVRLEVEVFGEYKKK